MKLLNAHSGSTDARKMLLNADDYLFWLDDTECCSDLKCRNISPGNFHFHDEHSINFVIQSSIKWPNQDSGELSSKTSFSVPNLASVY